jgi:Leucine-rich repeat (LRR) protein
MNTINSVFILLTGILILSSCTHQEVADDFTKLRAFEADLVQLSVQNPEMRSFPQLHTKLSNGHVVAITIRGRGLKQLPQSIYQLQHLTELAFEETAFSALPNLTPFANLNKLTVEYNLFKGPVHLRDLPTSLEYLTLSRDAITEVIVEDSLPRLSWLDLTQNRMRSRINPTFCKLPNLTFLDLSAGCCTTESQKIALEDAAKEILCNKKVAVRAEGRFID